MRVGFRRTTWARCRVRTSVTRWTGRIAPNLARWDYHATHVNQLLLLATIDPDPIIAQTAERWKNYMLGKRAQHN
ncbi:hypothetical protein quinque_008254 [Culex quinquefasciatus]